MKALGYTFSVKEKILLLLLTLVLMGLGYYYFIYMPTISEINEAGYRIEELTSEGDLLMDQIMALQSKQTELDGMDLENKR